MSVALTSGDPVTWLVDRPEALRPSLRKHGSPASARATIS
jgi:hypothetical protein